MKKLSIGALIVAAPLVISEASCQRETSQPQTRSPWHWFDSERHEFSVYFPQKPDIHSRPVPNAFYADMPDATVTAKDYTAESAHVHYRVSLWYYPVKEQRPSETVLDAIVDHILTDKKVKSRKPLFYCDWYPGREFQASYSSNRRTTVIHAKVIVSGWLIHEVWVQGDAEHMENQASDVEKFLRTYMLDPMFCECAVP
jgi:hypothetical protein